MVFRGNFEDKLPDIYFFFSNLLSLESKGKRDLILHWLYLYVTNKRYFVQLLGSSCWGAVGSVSSGDAPDRRL